MIPDLNPLKIWLITLLALNREALYEKSCKLCRFMTTWRLKSFSQTLQSSFELRTSNVYGMFSNCKSPTCCVTILPHCCNGLAQLDFTVKQWISLTRWDTMQPRFTGDNQTFRGILLWKLHGIEHKVALAVQTCIRLCTSLSLRS